MNSIHNRLRCLPLSLAIQSALFAVGAMTLSASTAYAATAEQRNYTIAAGTLTAVLNEFAMQADVLFSADAQVTDGLKSNGLAGRYTTEQGFKTILAPHGLDIEPTSQGYKLIKKTATQARDMGQLNPIDVKAQGSANRDANAVQLPVINVTAENENSYTVKNTSTATGLNLSIKDTPQTVSVITRQRMDDQALTNAVAVLEQAAGITISHDDGERYNIISRGGEITKFQIDGVQTSTLSINQLSPITLADMALYDRLEVVRGATGLMTGAGVPGGVVSLVRKKPTKDFQASVQGSVGRWDDYRGEADISGSLVENEKIRGRLVLSKQDKNSFTDYYGQEKDIIYGVVDTDLTDSTLLRFGVDYQKLHWDGLSGVPLFYSDGTQTNLPRSTSTSAPWGRTKQETYNYMLNLEQKLAHDWQFSIAANYMDAKNQASYANLVAYLFQSINKQTNQASLVSNGNIATEQTQKGVDLNVQGPFSLFGRQHEAIVGFNYSSYENTYENYGETVYLNYDFGALADLVPATKNPATGHTFHSVHQRGYYGALRLNPADRWHVILGARASDYSYDNHSLTFATGAKSGITKYQKNGEVTPYAGIVYDLTPQQSIYASYTDIFQPNSVLDANMQVLDPQVGSNYELGWKGEFHDGRLNTNIALYQIKRDNVAEYIGRIEGISIYQAIKGVKTKGVDLELSGEIRPDWNLSASYSYSRSENQTGERQLTYLPLDTVKLFTTYRLPNEWNKLTIGGGMNWNSKLSAYNSYLNGTAQQDAHAVFNVMARYQFNEKLSGSLNINNLFDKKYYQSINTYGFSYYGEPLNVLASLKYQF